MTAYIVRESVENDEEVKSAQHAVANACCALHAAEIFMETYGVPEADVLLLPFVETEEFLLDVVRDSELDKEPGVLTLPEERWGAGARSLERRELSQGHTWVQFDLAGIREAQVVLRDSSPEAEALRQQLLIEAFLDDVEQQLDGMLAMLGVEIGPDDSDFDVSA